MKSPSTINQVSTDAELLLEKTTENRERLSEVLKEDSTHHSPETLPTSWAWEESPGYSSDPYL